jgi:hypothetical protein
MCAACGQPYPCSPARVKLGEAYAGDRVGLAVYMGMQLEHAAGEIGGTTPPKELWERFLAWTRPYEPGLTPQARRQGCWRGDERVRGDDEGAHRSRIRRAQP